MFYRKVGRLEEKTEDLRITALDMALLLASGKQAIGQQVDAGQVTAYAEIFYEFLTKPKEGFAPATG